MTLPAFFPSAVVRGLREEAILGVRLLRRLPSLLRHPLTLDEAEAILARRLAERESGFLALARRAVYERPENPFRRLLRHAGCAYGDLEALVRRDGVEGALRVLLRHGVYLTVDEFKGRRPVVRGSERIEVQPEDLCNPWSLFCLPARTGGSRGAGSAVQVDLAFIRDRAVNTALVFKARGGTQWDHALWGVPGGSAMVRAVEFSAWGARPVRWFSQVPATAPGLHRRYRWSARAIRLGSLLAGRPLPRPEHVPFDDPGPIVRWLAKTLRQGRVPHLHTFASSVVQVCLAAKAAGIDLRGAQFTMASEPTTEARLRAVRAVGAGVQPCYAITDFGQVGYGCLAPTAPDDVHLFRDLHAVIQAGDEGAGIGLPRDALLLTSLRPTAPFLVMNVSTGDQAALVERSCGCAIERCGWSIHLRDIRSFEKLTAGGMTFLDGHVVRVLEEVLPARFGGGPTDYQLVEEESHEGRPRLRLLVHPRAGPVDGAAVAEAFLAALGAGSEAERVMELAWRRAGLLRVDREAPRTTDLGKILHLHSHVPRRDGAGSSGQRRPSG